jgi:hypothetical protein
MLQRLCTCCLRLLRCAAQVAGDATLELTLSQFWSSLGDSSMEVELSFHGLDAQPAAGALPMQQAGKLQMLLAAVAQASQASVTSGLGLAGCVGTPCVRLASLCSAQVAHCISCCLFHCDAPTQ